MQSEKGHFIPQLNAASEELRVSMFLGTEGPQFSAPLKQLLHRCEPLRAPRGDSCRRYDHPLSWTEEFVKEQPHLSFHRRPTTASDGRGNRPTQWPVNPRGHIAVNDLGKCPGILIQAQALHQNLLHSLSSWRDQCSAPICPLEPWPAATCRGRQVSGIHTQALVLSEPLLPLRSPPKA